MKLIYFVYFTCLLYLITLLAYFTFILLRRIIDIGTICVHMPFLWLFCSCQFISLFWHLWKCLKNNWAASVWQEIQFNPTRNSTVGLVWNASFKLYNHIRMASLYNFFIKTLRKFAAMLLLQSFTIINFLLHSITFGGLYFAALTSFKYAWNRFFEI